MAKQQPAPERSPQSWGTENTQEQEQFGRRGSEESRFREGGMGAYRPAGSRARAVTSINPRQREPVDPESPFLIPA
jgi:hypothetical protein